MAKYRLITPVKHFTIHSTKEAIDYIKSNKVSISWTEYCDHSQTHIIYDEDLPYRYYQKTGIKRHDRSYTYPCHVETIQGQKITSTYGLEKTKNPPWHNRQWMIGSGTGRGRYRMFQHVNRNMERDCMQALQEMKEYPIKKANRARRKYRRFVSDNKHYDYKRRQYQRCWKHQRNVQYKGEKPCWDITNLKPL